jgi:uncharacterized caspase-like protein
MPPEQPKGRRLALIIATDAYQDERLGALRAPARDAEALALVLGDASVGQFEVETLVNQDETALRRRIAAFFAGLERNDLALVHLSCHGVKDDDGRLYFASSDTQVALLDSTSISSEFLNRQMAKTASSQVVLFLDCCYSGAFARGMMARAGDGVDLRERFEGQGRIVITASSSTEYAFEGDARSGEGSPSIFTSALVHGLRSGEADQDLDGLVSIGELYEFVHDRVRERTPSQSPQKWVFGMEGEVYVAQSSRQVEATQLLPDELSRAARSEYVSVRQAAVASLAELIATTTRPRVADGARQLLASMCDDDSRRVSIAAEQALELDRDEPLERDTDVAPAPPASELTPVEDVPNEVPPAVRVEPAPPVPIPEPETPRVQEAPPRPPFVPVEPPVAVAPSARHSPVDEATDETRLDWLVVALAVVGAVAVVASNSTSRWFGHGGVHYQVRWASVIWWITCAGLAGLCISAFATALRPRRNRVLTGITLAAFGSVALYEWDVVVQPSGSLVVDQGREGLRIFGMIALSAAVLVILARIPWATIPRGRDRFQRWRYVVAATAGIVGITLIVWVVTRPYFSAVLQSFSFWFELALCMAGVAAVTFRGVSGLTMSAAAAAAFEIPWIAFAIDANRAGGFDLADNAPMLPGAVWLALALVAVLAVARATEDRDLARRL